MTSAPSPSYLQHFPAHNGPAHRIALDPLPFRIGRDKKTNYSISSKQISKKHAEITFSGAEFVIRDLGSTNGTFVNGQGIEETTLRNGDIIHFAHEEFRFVRSSESVSESNKSDFLFTEPVHGQVPASIAFGRQCLQEMLRQQSAQTLFQPIVHLNSEDPFGFEALARGTHIHLSIKPAELFALAEQCGLAPSLSQMFRQKAIAEASRLLGKGFLFLNLHSAEMSDHTLMESLRAIVGRTHWQLVLEIHENAASDLNALKEFRHQVKDLGMLVAYDDFGAGQARFLELAELPPDFIKLDMSLIRNLHLSPSRQKLIRGIVQSSQDQGVQVIAEGVESDEEAQVCRELGCNFAQGFLFGHPQPCSRFQQADKTKSGLKDRRTFSRLPGCGVVLVRPKEESTKAVARSGRIIDLSKSGIALSINFHFPIGTILTLAPVGWDGSSSLAAKVVHCREVDGQWLHGCEFLEKLQRRDLDHFWSFNLKVS